MTFIDLQQAVYADCGYSTTPPPDVQARVKRWINQAQRILLRSPVLSGQRDGTLDLTSVSGQGVYGLPQAFARIDRIVQKSNNRRLAFRTRDWFRAADPGETSTGVPDCWIPEGRQSVTRHPNRTSLWAVSGSTADVTQTVAMTGVRAGGYRQAQLTVTLNGITPVVFVPAFTYIDWVRVLTWSLNADAAGDVFLLDSGATPVDYTKALAAIPAHSATVNYQGVRLWPTPTDVLTYTIDGQFVIPDLIQDRDVPMISDDWHDTLQMWARRCEYERTADRRFALVDHDWMEVIAGLKSESEFPSDYRPVAGKFSGRVGVNNLGGWYPADYFR